MPEITRQQLLRQAEEADLREHEEALAIDRGEGSDMVCTHYHARAQHLRYLAATAPDERDA